MFGRFEEILIGLTDTLSLPAFALIGSFVEEIIAPIPSPVVMLVLGSLVEVGGGSYVDLIPLALIGALGKTLGASFVYFVADKAEDFVMGRFGKYFGVTHADVERFGRRLGNDVRDYLLLTLLRALPFVPSVVLSVGSGVLKVPIRVFLVSTFLGTIVRDAIYLYAGFVGTEALRTFVDATSYIETEIELLIGVFILGLLAYLYIRTKKTMERQ